MEHLEIKGHFLFHELRVYYLFKGCKIRSLESFTQFKGEWKESWSRIPLFDLSAFMLMGINTCRTQQRQGGLRFL